MGVFGVATLINILVSPLLSSIADSLRCVSAAAIEVRRATKQREEIPSRLNVVPADAESPLSNLVDVCSRFVRA